MPARLQEHYTKTVREALTKEFSYKNPFEVPKLDKVVINMGVGEAVNDRKAVDAAAAELAAITGQKPIVTKSRLSIATFKLREGMAIGTKVTLRRDRMYEFIDRLINIALPRVATSAAERQVVRRQWQLRHGPEGTARVPRDRLRQGRPGARHGHHHLHDSEDGRGSQGAFSVPSTSRS